MEKQNVIGALAALAHETRLDAFRLLVEAGPLGMPAGAIAKELKLWGPDRDVILRLANRIEPARLAQLLRSAIDSDRRTKRGIGRPARTLEVLAVEIADTVRCA